MYCTYQHPTKIRRSSAVFRTYEPIDLHHLIIRPHLAPLFSTLLTRRRYALLHISWELLQQLHVDVLDLWAAQLADNIGNDICQRIDYPEQEVWLRLRRKLSGKAREVVAFKEASGVEHAASEVRDVDAGEGVDLALVTVTRSEIVLYGGRHGNDLPANVKELRMQACGCEEVAKEILDRVGVFESTTVLRLSQHPFLQARARAKASSSTPTVNLPSCEGSFHAPAERNSSPTHPRLQTTTSARRSLALRRAPRHYG